MKIFIDSAQIEEIEKAAETGLIDGVTTNPSLVAKQGGSFEKLLLRICELIDGPISAEVTALDAPSMIQQGIELSKLHPNITVKIPLTPEGLKACKKLSSSNIKTNVTLCFSAPQALLAAKAGATFVSPFVGRLDDIGHEGMDLIRDIRDIYDQYGFTTEILAASIRHPQHVLASAKLGADVVTLPYKVFQSLYQHPLTDRGLDQFMKDWESYQKKLNA